MKVTEKGEEYSQLSLNDEGSPQRDSAEHEEYAGAYSPKRITENNITNVQFINDFLFHIGYSATHSDNVAVLLKGILTDFTMSFERRQKYNWEHTASFRRSIYEDVVKDFFVFLVARIPQSLSVKSSAYSNLLGGWDLTEYAYRYVHQKTQGYTVGGLNDKPDAMSKLLIEFEKLVSNQEMDEEIANDKMSIVEKAILNLYQAKKIEKVVAEAPTETERNKTTEILHQQLIEEVNLIASYFIKDEAIKNNYVVISTSLSTPVGFSRHEDFVSLIDYCVKEIIENIINYALKSNTIARLDFDSDNTDEIKRLLETVSTLNPNINSKGWGVWSDAICNHIEQLNEIENQCFTVHTLQHIIDSKYNWCFLNGKKIAYNIRNIKVEEQLVINFDEFRTSDNNYLCNDSGFDFTFATENELQKYYHSTTLSWNVSVELAVFCNESPIGYYCVS